jgi:hypothetical protein
MGENGKLQAKNEIPLRFPAFRRKERYTAVGL